MKREAPWEICQIAGRREIVAFFPARGVMRSLDGGETWEDFSQGLEVNPACDIGDSSSPGRSGPVEEGKGGIYRTANAGNDWEWFGEGLPKGVDLFKDWEWGKGGPYPQLYFGVDGSAVCYSAKIWKGWYLDRETSTWRESQDGAERVPSGCSSKVLVDRKRLFYLSTGSGVFTRVLP